MSKNETVAGMIEARLACLTPEQWAVRLAEKDKRIAELEAENERLNDACENALNGLMEEKDQRIAELEAAQRWQPIETAPRDGARFLTFTPGKNAYSGVRVGKAHIRPDHDDWLSHVDGSGASWKGGPRPTHWMPLPAAPKMKKEGGE